MAFLFSPFLCNWRFYANSAQHSRPLHIPLYAGRSLRLRPVKSRPPAGKSESVF